MNHMAEPNRRRAYSEGSIRMAIMLPTQGFQSIVCSPPISVGTEEVRTRPCRWQAFKNPRVRRQVDEPAALRSRRALLRHHEALYAISVRKSPMSLLI